MADRGNEKMLLYPEVEVTDSRGNVQMLPDLDHPVTVRCSVSTDRQSIAELPGQVDVKVLKVMCRKFPAGTWARIALRGEDWDLASPPVRQAGMSRATRHVELILRSRNQDNG